MAIITKSRPLLPVRFVHSRLSGVKVAPHQIQAFYKRTPNPKIKIPQVTLWAASWGRDSEMLNRTLRVLCYCRHNIEFGRIIHFSRTQAPFEDCPWETILIPELNMSAWNIFVNRVVPNYIKTSFAMSVHEDGFPMHFDLWDSKFLDYDYIGAPWPDGTVGNGGFNIESSKMLQAKTRIPMTAQELISPSDTYICVNRRRELESIGIRFAPKELAFKFSTETIRNELRSFGFHGRGFSPNKFNEGWQIIKRSEKV